MSDMEAYAATPPPYPNPDGDRASTVGRNFYPLNLSARQQELIRLAALGHNMADIAKMLGSVRVDSIRAALKVALGKQAKILREAGAWDQAFALHMSRMEMLIATWLPKAVGGDESTEPDLEAAKYVSTLLAQAARIGGFDAAQKVEITAPPEGQAQGTRSAAAVAAIVSRLAEVADRQKIIDVDEVPVSELDS